MSVDHSLELPLLRQDGNSLENNIYPFPNSSSTRTKHSTCTTRKTKALLCSRTGMKMVIANQCSAYNSISLRINAFRHVHHPIIPLNYTTPDNGPTRLRIKIWRERLYMELYYILLTGAVCSRPYSAPFVLAE